MLPRKLRGEAGEAFVTHTKLQKGQSTSSWLQCKQGSKYAREPNSALPADDNYGKMVQDPKEKCRCRHLHPFGVCKTRRELLSECERMLRSGTVKEAWKLSDVFNAQAYRSCLECLRKSPTTSARSHTGNMKLHQGQAETKCSAAASTKKGTTRQGARQRWQRSWHCEPRRSHAGNIRAKRSEAALNKPAGQGPGPVKPNLKVRAMQLCNAAHRKLQREAANCKCKPGENASEGSFATGAAAPTVSDGANTWSGLVCTWSCNEA